MSARDPPTWLPQRLACLWDIFRNVACYAVDDWNIDFERLWSKVSLEIAWKNWLVATAQVNAFVLASSFIGLSITITSSRDGELVWAICAGAWAFAFAALSMATLSSTTKTWASLRVYQERWAYLSQSLRNRYGSNACCSQRWWFWFLRSIVHITTVLGLCCLSAAVALIVDMKVHDTNPILARASIWIVAVSAFLAVLTVACLPSPFAATWHAPVEPGSHSASAALADSKTGFLAVDAVESKAVPNNIIAHAR
jgi:hypothetical protein